MSCPKQIDAKLFCDETGVLFLRQYRYQNGIVTSTIDTELDGKTVYTPQGEVTLCSSGGGCCDVTDVEVTPTFSEVSAAGTVAAGARSVSFANVGSAAGTVLGSPLFPGEMIAVDGYFDEEAKEFVRLGELAYDASAANVTFHILVTT